MRPTTAVPTGEVIERTIAIARRSDEVKRCRPQGLLDTGRRALIARNAGSRVSRRQRPRMLNDPVVDDGGAGRLAMRRMGLSSRGAAAPSRILDRLGLAAVALMILGPLLAWLRLVPGLAGFASLALGG